MNFQQEGGFAGICRVRARQLLGADGQRRCRHGPLGSSLHHGVVRSPRAAQGQAASADVNIIVQKTG